MKRLRETRWATIGVFVPMRLLLLLVCPLVLLSAPQARHAPVHKRHRPVAPENPAAVAQGKAQFGATCAFCHGADATGGRGPDLVRSDLVSHDKKGSLLTPFVHAGRPDKGMPAFPNLTDKQIADIAAFLHYRQFQALHNGSVPSTYPVSRMLTGNAAAGKRFFYGAGRCSQCHSITGDLAGVAKKYSPVELQQEMVYPSQEAPPETAVVTLPDGTEYEGEIAHKDEFRIALICKDGWYRSWPVASVRVDLHDPLKAHRELMTTYTDADIHNLFAFLETLK